MQAISYSETESRFLAVGLSLCKYWSKMKNIFKMFLDLEQQVFIGIHVRWNKFSSFIVNKTINIEIIVNIYQFKSKYFKSFKLTARPWLIESRIETLMLKFSVFLWQENDLKIRIQFQVPCLHSFNMACRTYFFLLRQKRVHTE